MDNLAHQITDVKEYTVDDLSDELDRIFGPEGTFTKAAGDLHRTVEEAKATVDRFFCEAHQKFKEDLFSDGDMMCEQCFIDYYHAGNEGLEDEVGE